MLVAVGCGSSVTPPGARDVPFAPIATTQLSSYDGGPAVIAGTTAATRARIAELAPGAAAGSDRILIAVFEGSQRTGGYAIRVDGVARDGDRLLVRAAFTRPAPGAMVTQVLTSPAQVVSIAELDAAGVRQVVLLDAQGIERARADVR